MFPRLKEVSPAVQGSKELTIQSPIILPRFKGERKPQQREKCNYIYGVIK